MRKGEGALCADVAVPLPIEGVYSYLIPEDQKEKVKPGVRVLVPFKNREMTGYVTCLNQVTDSKIRLKPLLQILDEEPVLTQPILELTQWMAGYYLCSWGEAIENALPKWVKYGKKAEKALKKEKEAAAASKEIVKDLSLTGAQSEVLEVICQSFNTQQSKPILIHGVTGSGKSELYIRAIREVLQQNRSAICLVPEIALTEQIRRFFLQHFGEELEILHSKLGDSERFLAWKRIEAGKKRVILGPRSAVFAPLRDLGLIIMDEEHENTYKQETTPRYHAREVAAWRARHEKALFIMGTATPSLESMHRARQGDYQLVELKERVDQKAMPKVEIIDLKNAIMDRRKPAMFSPRLWLEIESNLQKKEGTMLLLNRRGFSTHIHCPGCGQVENCPSCQVSLTFHQAEDRLLCHYCNFQKQVSEVCGHCRVPLLRFAGFGTEKIESEVAARFPAARVARMDADSVRKKGSHEEILRDFREQKIDILIGTQMIAKGFDFPHVTLVGVILADVGLMLPDFRSAERTFQLLTQVAGRAGRGKIPGRVYIQTFSPDHPSVQLARRHDFNGFYQQELPQRREYHYPPLHGLINIIIRSKDENKAYLFAREIRDSLRQTFSLRHREALSFSVIPAKAGIQDLDPPVKPGDDNRGNDDIEIMGPAQLPFYRLRGHFRWHVMLKLPREHESYHAAIKQCLLGVKRSAHVQFAIDVDPVNIL